MPHSSTAVGPVAARQLSLQRTVFRSAGSKEARIARHACTSYPLPSLSIHPGPGKRCGNDPSIHRAPRLYPAESRQQNNTTGAQSQSSPITVLCGCAVIACPPRLGSTCRLLFRHVKDVTQPVSRARRNLGRALEVNPRGHPRRRGASRSSSEHLRRKELPERKASARPQELQAASYQHLWAQTSPP